jgi:antirestriction protein ArdC/DNA polymerase III epsilon subunit-like protein
VPRYQNRSKLNSKTLTTRDQAESLKKKVYSILDKANSEFSAERRVSRRAATLVVKKSLKTTLGLQYSLREHRALKALSEFLNFSQTGKMVSKSVEEFTDLLPMGHPESTKKHSMTASAFANARLLWVLADPRISEEAKPLVASVLVDAKDSPSYLYALTRLEYDTDSALPLQALIAAYGGGNSREARSARARLQRRDKYGRFAFQGGGLSVNVRRSNGNINRLTGRTVADTPSSSIIETPDGKIYSINEDSGGQLPGEYVKAILENTPDGISPVPAIVKTGDPVVDEKDLVTLEVPPGFKKDESYKGVGTRYTDDAYDVIKFDKPSTQTRDRIGAAVKYATANDLPEIDQKKKGEDGKIWNQDKPIFEISRRGGKAFAFTQSWADTQESIEVDEPRLDASEGRTPELSRDEKLEVIQARLDAGDNLTDILPDIFDSPKKKKSKTQEPVSSTPPPPTPPKSTQTPEPESEEPAKPEISEEEFSWKVPTGGYLLATDSEYDPEGRTDQESKDYTDDPDIVGNKFSTGELVQGLEQALTSPDLIDSQETTDLIDQIRSDDEADGISTDELDDNYEPTPEEIAEQEEILKKVKNRKVNNLATGYGSLSFSGGEELVPAEAIYFALKAQGEDADKIVARIYDNASGGTENIDALNASRGNVVETTVPDIADIIDSPSEDGVDPSADPWDPESYELAALRKDLSNGFDESGVYNAERNGFIFESDSDSGDISINVIEGRDRSKVATIKEDGSLEWNSKNDLREAQDLQNDHGQDLWDTFVEYSNDESINLPAAMRNMTQEQIDKYAKDNEHFDFLKENDFYGDYTQVGLHNISSDSFDDWTDLGDMPEYPFVSNNPVYLAQVLDTDSLKQSLQNAMYNKKDGTSPIAFTDDNGEDVEFDIPAEAFRDALQLQGVDTDEILFEMFISNDLNFNAEETEYGFRSLDEARKKASSDAREALKTQKTEQAQSTETLLTTVNSVENQNSSTPPAEELPVPQRGFVRTVDLKPGDVSVKDGFVITEIGRDQIVGKNGAMRKVKGYFPGHQEQDTKQWYEDTPIEVYRGIPVPPKGDLPPLSKTTVKQGKMKQEDYDKSLATARGLVQEPEIVMPINDLKTGKDDSVEELPTDTVDAPEKTTAPKSFNRVKYPTFQGRFAQLVRDAEGDPEEFKKLLDQEEYTIFDYETTGLDVNNPEHNPIQISAIKVKNGEVVDSFNAFMNPDASLSEWNISKSVDTDGNPITQEWIDSQQSRADAHKQFLEWLGDSPMLAGFNVGFDEGFLKANLEEAGLTYSPSGVMDVLALGRSSLWGDKTRPTKKDENGQIIINEYGTAMYDNTLKALSDYLGVNLDNWHDSRSDVEATKGVFEGMIQKSIENKGNKRKLSSFDVDARLADYEKSLAALDVANVDKNPVVDSIESANVGAPDPNAQEIIGSDKDSALDENVDPYISIPSNKVLPGDIAIRPNEAFIVVAIVPDPENRGKVIVNGYYPGHEIQEKTWNGDTVINIVRGIPESDLPKSGDGASIERPVRLGAYKSGNSQFDRDDAIHTAKKYRASSVYSRNPLNNRDIARDRENIKTTNPNTQEGRTNDWIRNNQNTANIVGARVTDLREGDYVRLTLPEDPLVYGYINKIEFDDVEEKATIYFVNTNNGEISSREWRFKAGMNDVRRPLRDQEKSDIRPLDLNIEGVDPVASDGKTPIKPNDNVSHDISGISGNVVEVTNATGSDDADKRKPKLISVKNSDGDTHLLDPNKVSNITDEPYVYRDIDADFERQRDERMNEAPPSVKQAEFITEDVAKTYEKSPLNGSKNHDVYLFFGNNKFARGNKIETDNGNVLLTISGYSNPVSYPYGDIKSIAITPKRNTNNSTSLSEQAPSDQSSSIETLPTEGVIDGTDVSYKITTGNAALGNRMSDGRVRTKERTAVEGNIATLYLTGDTSNLTLPDPERNGIWKGPDNGDRSVVIERPSAPDPRSEDPVLVAKKLVAKLNEASKTNESGTPNLEDNATPLQERTEGLIVFPEPDPQDKSQKKLSPKLEEIKTKLLSNIEEDLRNGVLPWEKKWTGVGFGMFPYNLSTKKPYKGYLNALTLMYVTEDKGYSSNRWIGKKQAEAMGGKLKSEDEMPTEILAPIMKTKDLLDAEGKPTKDKDGKPKTYQVKVGFSSKEVYNADQFDGLPELKEEERTPIEASEAEEEVLRRYKDHPPISFIDMPDFDSPHYSGGIDEIVLPKREQYGEDQLGFLKTLFHELAHSTGAQKRLNRFGENYSQPIEEMTAEITAAMVGSFIGLDLDREHTSAYIDSWLSGIGRNPEALFLALEKAVAATNYIVGDEDLGEEDSSTESNIKSISGDIQKGIPNTGDFINGMKYEISLEEQDLGTGTQKEIKAVRKLTVSGNTFANKEELKNAGFTYNGKEKSWSKKYFSSLPVESLTQEELDNNPDQGLAGDLSKFIPEANLGSEGKTGEEIAKETEDAKLDPAPQPDSEKSPETVKSRVPGTPTGGNNFSHRDVLDLLKSRDPLQDKVYKAEDLFSRSGQGPVMSSSNKPMMRSAESFSSIQEYNDAYKKYVKEVTKWAQNENRYIMSEIGKKHLKSMNLDGNAKPIQNYIDEVVNSPWFIEAFGDGGVIKTPKAMIRQNNTAGVYAVGLKNGKPLNSITIHRYTVQAEPTILHEIAHYATTVSSKDSFEPHGTEFIKNLLFIMSKVAGEGWASLYEERLKEAGISLEK